MAKSWHEQTIVITGSSGSGKSQATKILDKLGAVTGDADDFARTAVAPSNPALTKIRETFGPGVITENGHLDRKALGKIVFSDPSKLKSLEAIIHPEVRRLAEQYFERAIAEGRTFLVYDCPLVFETGLYKLGFKKILLVTAPTETRLKRIMARDNITREEALKRNNSQMPEDEKARLADIVIDNSGTVEELQQRLVGLIDSDFCSDN